jgi:hypothetical protein
MTEKLTQLKTDAAKVTQDTLKDSRIIVDLRIFTGKFFTIKTSKGETITVSEVEGVIAIKNKSNVNVVITGQESDSN